MKKICLVLLAILSITSFAKNMVITSIQPLYSLTSYLVEGTDIQVKSVFDSSVSMDTSIDAFADKELDLSYAKDAEAVVGLSRVWTEDKLYGKARQQNINIIEIEVGTAFDGFTNFFVTEREDGRPNYYLWTSSKNLVKMASIVARDLSRIYPNNKNKIEKNLVSFIDKLNAIDTEASNKLINLKEDSIISLSDNLDYFVNDLNIFTTHYDYNSVTADNVEKLMADAGTKVIISDRWLKKAIIKKIKELGGEFVYIETLNIPLDDNGQMDKDALLKTHKENLEKIINVLK